MAEHDENDLPRNRNRDRDRDDRDDRDDRPRRRRDRDEDFDDRRLGGEPKKSNAGVIIAIIVGVFVAGIVILGILVALLLPAVSKVREAAARSKDSNNLKQVGIAMHWYNDANAKMPPADGPVSWRVHLLPYVEQENIYRQFDLKQPWDGPTNKRFASQRIPQYVSVGDPPETVETRYRVFVGPGTLYEPGKPALQFPEIRDGTSNTFFAVEAGETVPWPQPKELQYDRNGPLPALGSPGRNVVLAIMMDGSVRPFSTKTSSEVIRGGIEPNDGKFFDP